MVFSARLEHNFFLIPSHRPVNAPAEFSAFKGAQVNSFTVTALAFVGNVPFSVVSGNLRRIPAAFIAENSNRPVYVFRLHFMLFVPVFVQAFLYYIAVLHRLFHTFRIAVCTVPACLIQEFRMYSDARKLLLNVNFVMARVIFVASCCIRNFSNRIAQVFFKNFRLWHIRRNFAEYVIVIPRIDKADVLAAVAECAYN